MHVCRPRYSRVVSVATLAVSTSFEGDIHKEIYRRDFDERSQGSHFIWTYTGFGRK